MAGEREGQRGEARTAKDRGEAGNMGMLGRRQVTPRWEDDPVYVGGGGVGSVGGCPPRKDTRRRERRMRRDKYEYVTISYIS